MESPALCEHIDHDCVDGLPLAMDFADTLRAHSEFEFDDALADGLVPEHEVKQHMERAA